MNDIVNSASTDSLKTRSARQVWEHHIHAFVELCPQPSDGIVKPDDNPNQNLSVITVGVKDIIDVKGVPTRNGQKL